MTAFTAGSFPLTTQERFPLEFVQTYRMPEINLTDPTLLQDFVAANAGIETNPKEQITSIAVDTFRIIYNSLIKHKAFV